MNANKKQDIQNLILGIIFGYNGEFDCDIILKEVRQKVNDKQFSIDDTELEKLVKDNLNLLSLAGAITKINNTYKNN